jgi:DNA (cytosine-5)-methyltransferase 1
VREQELVSVSLFSGAGGLDLGLSQARRGQIKFKAWAEIDADARATLCANHRDAAPGQVFANVKDIEPANLCKVTQTKRGQFFLLAGGPPCQSFSTAGLRRSIHEDRGEVVSHYFRLLRALKPRFFVFENVRGLLSVAIKHRNYRERIAQEQVIPGFVPEDEDQRLGSVFTKVVLPQLEASGYEVVYGLLNAADYGVAQVRRRLFIIGSRDREFGAGRYRKETGQRMTPLDLMPPTHHQFAPYKPIERWRTLRDAIGHLSALEPNPDEAFTYSRDRAAVWALIPPGRNWTYVRDHPEEFERGFLERIMGNAISSGGGKMGFWRRLSWDRPSPTLPTQPQHLATGLCHPDQARPLSVAEYAAIQGFSDSYKFSGNKASKYLQIGNAVPVRLGRALGEMLLAVASKEHWALSSERAVMARRCRVCGSSEHDRRTCPIEMESRLPFVSALHA